MNEPLVLDPAELDVSRRLTLLIVLTATAILLVSGLLGLLIRDSQADVGRLPPQWFYALMTAHGLGAFIGWAGFAVMGFAYWVLAQVGFPLGRWGRVLAELTYWLMVGGVLGIVLTTLVFKFGASWVFLYPLPFHGAGAWGDWTAGFFSFSVLLVGLSIVTWCLSILVVVTGPALHAVSSPRRRVEPTFWKVERPPTLLSVAISLLVRVSNSATLTSPQSLRVLTPAS